MSANAIALFGIALSHWVVDISGGFVSPLLPLFAEKFSLSLALVGILVSILNVADGLTQPIFGYLGDRIKRPIFLTFTPFLVSLGTGLLGISPSYGILALFLVIAGLGRSAFHPQGAASIAQYAGRKRALGLSVFMAAGNIGFAMGPILATVLVSCLGLSGTLAYLPLGLLATGFLYLSVLRDPSFRPSSWTPLTFRDVLKEIGRSRGAFLRLWLIVVLRSFTYFTLFAFLPVFLAQKGLSTLQTGFITSFFFLGGAIGGIMGGWIAEKINERFVIATSLGLAFPLFQLALTVSGITSTALLMAGGFCLVSSTPVTISLGQRYAPGSAATASSLLLGLGWGTGGLLVGAVGALADRIGVIGAMRIQELCLLLAFVFALGLHVPEED